MSPEEFLVDALRVSDHVVVMTGAGTSAESGVPTFREAQTGLWSRYDPTELATPDAFARQPQLVWDWYEWRRQMVLSAEPNPGHIALVGLETRLPELTLITQNVDGLHQRAGSSHVTELHGSLLRAKCFDRGHIAAEWPAGSEEHPVCPICGSLMRPDVVWFNESLPAAALARAAEAARTCDLFLSIGTSSVVYPAASFAAAAVQNGAKLIEINTDDTPLTEHATRAIRGKSGAVLPAAMAILAAS